MNVLSFHAYIISVNLPSIEYKKSQWICNVGEHFMKMKGTEYDETFLASHILYMFNLYNMGRQIKLLAPCSPWLCCIMPQYRIQHETIISISPHMHTPHTCNGNIILYPLRYAHVFVLFCFALLWFCHYFQWIHEVTQTKFLALVKTYDYIIAR